MSVSQAVSRPSVPTPPSSKRLLTALGGLLLGLGVAGCQGLQAPETSSAYRMNVEMEDIPYPESFSFVDGWRYEPQDLQAANFRSWGGRYRGPGTPDKHVPYFVEEMTRRSWTLLRIVEEVDGRKTLQFTKGGEAATIELSRVFDGRTASFGSELRARIRPLGPEELSPELLDALVGAPEGSTGTAAVEAPTRADATRADATRADPGRAEGGAYPTRGTFSTN